MKAITRLLFAIGLVFIAASAFSQGLQLTNSDGATIILNYKDIVQVYPNSSDKAVILYGNKNSRHVDTTDFDKLLQIAGCNLILFTDANHDDREIAIPTSSILRVTTNTDDNARIFQQVPQSGFILSYDAGEAVADIQALVAGCSYPTDVLTGGVTHTDTSYRATPFVLNADTTVTLPNVSDLSTLTQLPSDLDSLWSPSDSTILGKAGDILSVTVSFNIEANTANATWIEVFITVDGTTVIGAPAIALPKGQDESQYYSWTFTAQVDAAWETNGAKIRVTSGGDSMDITDDIDLAITRLRKASN